MLNIAVGIIHFLKIYHILHIYQRLCRKIETLYDMITRRKDLFLIVVSILFETNLTSRKNRNRKV